MRRVSIKEIMDFLEQVGMTVSYHGKRDFSVDGFCSLSNPKAGCITWIKVGKTDFSGSLKKLDGCIVVSGEEVGTIDCAGYILTEKPKEVFFRIVGHFWNEGGSYGIAESSIVRTKEIGKRVLIGENCTIGEDVVIGNDTVIEHNVCIYHRVKIGKGCIIHSGTVIGADGFGYFIDALGRPEKVQHYGGIVIGDMVEIGANVCIDRGTIDNTVIGTGVKIDNLVHIAHNVQIEDYAMVVAGAIICGSARLEEGSYVAPGGIVKNQVTVMKSTFIGMGAVVTKDTEEGMVYAGIPAKALRKTQKTDK